MKNILFIVTGLTLLIACTSQKKNALKEWELGPFVKVDSLNPILGPDNARFFDPIREDTVAWEIKDVFNPCAVVKDNKVYMLYRAEDSVGRYNGTSRIGLAVSNDGLHFQRYPVPVFYPDQDQYQSMEWEGGVEDPRIAEDDDGTYYMTYTAYNGKKTRLCIATSQDLVVWRKHGIVFKAVDPKLEDSFSFKSGLIVTRLVGDRLVATKINGKYWMFWDVGELYLATSDDLIHWEPVKNDDGSYKPALQPRQDKVHVDNVACEPGPAAILTNNGILVFYNGISNGGTNAKTGETNEGLTWAGVQVLFDKHDPFKEIARAEDAFIRPEKAYEKTGQVNNVTFIEGLVHFRDQWLMYYGTADSYIATAVDTNPRSDLFDIGEVENVEEKPGL